MEETIAGLVEKAQTFLQEHKGSVLHKYFEATPNADGVVVITDEHQPVGLIMRNHFYQKIGSQFGFALYLNRPIELIMKRDILILDVQYDLAKFGYEAMRRHADNVYDYVVVTNEGRYDGVVSISHFLAVMSEMKEREILVLNEQQRLLREAHEQERQFRRQIELKNREIKNLMNHAEQGFLSFREDLIIYEEYSRVCEEIFGKPIGGLHLIELLESYAPDDMSKQMMHTFNSLFAQTNRQRAKIYIRLLPESLFIRNRHIDIDYKVIDFKEKKVLMVILTDVTDKKALENKSIEEKNNMKLVLTAMNHKSEILDALEEAQTFFETSEQIIAQTEYPVQTLFRAVHTMKGDFSLHAFHNTAMNLHLLEDKLSKMLETQTKEGINDLFKSVAFDDFVSRDLEIISSFLGDDFFQTEKRVVVHYDRIQDLEKLINKRFPPTESSFILEHFHRLTYPTINEVLQGYGDYTKLISIKLNKQIEDFQVTGDSVYINPKIFAGLTKSLIHIFRNIADHGIEFPDERAEKNKPISGSIHCHVEKGNGTFKLSIRDDGGGISSDTIAKKAIEQNLVTQSQLKQMTEGEIINLIFEDSFSTRETVSMLSGRGIGLSSVKEKVRGLGGTIHVSTQLDVGTVFVIELPLE